MRHEISHRHLPDSKKATRRVNNPKSISNPPKNSDTPATHFKGGNELEAACCVDGKPKSFSLPCSIKSKAAAMRKTLNKRGVHLE